MNIFCFDFLTEAKVKLYLLTTAIKIVHSWLNQQYSIWIQQYYCVINIILLNQLCNRRLLYIYHVWIIVKSTILLSKQQRKVESTISNIEIESSILLLTIFCWILIQYRCRIIDKTNNVVVDSTILLLNTQNIFMVKIFRCLLEMITIIC